MLGLFITFIIPTFSLSSKINVLNSFDSIKFFIIFFCATLSLFIMSLMRFHGHLPKSYNTRYHFCLYMVGHATLSVVFSFLVTRTDRQQQQQAAAGQQWPTEGGFGGGAPPQSNPFR